MVAGSLMMIPTYLLMGFTDLTPVIAMSIMGMAFSLVPAAMWPSLPYIITESRLGSAYGLMTMIQNVGLTIYPYIIGWARDRTGNYSSAMMVFSITMFAAFIFAVLLRQGERDRLERGSAELKEA